MEGHRGERMTQADDDDPKAANKHWSAGAKPGPPKYNVPWTCALREIGSVPKRPGSGGPPIELQWAAEDELIGKTHEEFQCQLPSTSRSTFLMVFSPDGTKVASTHGDHNVYVTDLPSGKGVRKLSGHPRTPWCLAFHPSSNQILASGCLGGQVRVWDLHGGSELWTAESRTVIASLAFHPTDRMLVVATYNELHFWDWSQPVPFAKCFTASEKERVRYVTFDPLGHKLITGIANRTYIQSQWDRSPLSVSNPLSTSSLTTYSTTPLPSYLSSMSSMSSSSSSSSVSGGASSSNSSGAAPRSTSSYSSQSQTSLASSSSQSSARAAPPSSSSALNPSEQENRVTVCFRSLMEQYEQLVQRYYDLSREQVVAGSSRNAGRYTAPSTSGTAQSASRTDRGSDPIEQDPTASPPVAQSSSNDNQSASPVSGMDYSTTTSRLESLRANLRRFRHPNFIHMPGFQRRGRSAVTRLTNQSIPDGGRGDSRGEERSTPSQPQDSRLLPQREVQRMAPLSSTDNRQRSVTAVPAPSSANPSTSSSSETPAPAAPVASSRPFASVRSAFRPRLSSLRAPEQAALDLRVRSSQPNTDSSAATTSTFSTSLRSAFQPRTSASRTGGVATRGSSSGRQGSRFSSPPADVNVRFGIQLLSRHIDNMQRLCRARLEILQLQQIRRMWEDLQRQIGSLHAAVRDGSGASGAANSPPAASSPSANSNPPSPPATSPPSASPPPRPSRPPLLPPSPPPLPPPPLSSSPSSGEDEGVEVSPDPRAEDEEDGLRVRELMELARISGGEEPDGPSRSVSAEGPGEGGGGSGEVSSGMAAAPFRDRPGNQTSRKRARVPSRFPEPGPSRRVRLVARMSTTGRPASRGRPMPYSTGLGFLPSRLQRRTDIGSGACGPPYVFLQRLPEGVVSAAGSTRQSRTDVDGLPWEAEAEISNEDPEDVEESGVPEVQDPEDATADNASTEDGPVVEVPVIEVTDGAAQDGAVPIDAEPAVEVEVRTVPAPSAVPAAEPSSATGGPTASQINTFRQAGEDFHGRFCSMISRLEVLVMQQRENRESYWRSRGDTLWSRREAGRPEGSSRGPTDSGRGSSDGPPFTFSDSSGDESDSNNVVSPLARRIHLLKQRHLRERQRRGWGRGLGDNGRIPFSSAGPAPTEPASSSPPPSTSTHVPTAPSSSTLRDEPSTSSGTPSDAEWQWTRESTRLRARQVLSMMVESLTQFFEQHGLSQETPHAVLDEQIYNLYVLLQLALELTDLLLIQLMSTRRELEEQWVNSLRNSNSDNSNSQDPTARRSSPPTSNPSPPSPHPHGLRLMRALPRHFFPRPWGDSEGSQQPTNEEREPNAPPSSEPNPQPRRFFTVPEVQVNDVPIAPEAVSLLGEPPGGRSRARSPPPPVNIFVPVGGPRNVPMGGSPMPISRRGRPNPFVQLHPLRRLGAGTGGLGASGGNGGGGTGEGRFRRFLHPRYVGPNPLGDEYREDPLHETMESILRDASMSITHRIQAWDFSSCSIPEIGDWEQNVVVPECKIHNDACVDVSSDGRMLVTLLPPGRLQINTMLGIYSLEWGSLGECLFIMSLAQNAVSVSLSPTCRHLAVGLVSRRVALLPSDRHTMAQLYRLDSAPPYPSPPPSTTSSKGKGVGKGLRRGGSGNIGSSVSGSQVIGHLHHVRDIDQGRGQGYSSLNCIRWMPGAGQGLVYGTNTGQLKVLR